jgi:hypothetical protein
VVLQQLMSSQPQQQQQQQGGIPTLMQPILQPQLQSNMPLGAPLTMSAAMGSTGLAGSSTPGSLPMPTNLASVLAAASAMAAAAGQSSSQPMGGLTGGGQLMHGSMMGGAGAAAAARGSDLTSRISVAPQISDVLTLISERGSGIYTEHLCQAVHRIAILKAAGAEVSPAARVQLADMVAMIQGRVGGMTPKQLSEVLWGLAQVRPGGDQAMAKLPFTPPSHPPPPPKVIIITCPVAGRCLVLSQLTSYVLVRLLFPLPLDPSRPNSSPPHSWLWWWR